MSVSKDSVRGTWTVYVRYTDWQGCRREKRKRGFVTKRAAQEFERQFLLQKSRDISMKFSQFVQIYLEDVGPRLRANTLHVRENMIRTKILPFFGNRSLSGITATDVIQWQNQLLTARNPSGKPYSQTYLRTIQNLLSAIFHHACRFYDLPRNPCDQIPKIGKGKAKEMMFWTREEYLKFSAAVRGRPVVFYAFELLYWCGLREGELLALRRQDVDLTMRQLSVCRSLQRIRGKDVITEPKTEKSIRTIELPDFLCEELEEYFSMLYDCQPESRLFEGINKFTLHREMDRGAAEAGVKRIRIHDLRHSHVAYLIEKGFSPMEIAARLGHESISVTYQYAHLYPSKQRFLADRIQEEEAGDRQ
ncbi:MAG: tyrosine-type recombinase/integrase [Anaerovoracaceae bacterium]